MGKNGASGSRREGDLNAAMRREIAAAGARFARFDFDPGASQEGREVWAASQECDFGWRLSFVGLEGERDG